jgi:hypothetical protein
MAFEACLDVASHVLADRGLRAPSTYAETFAIYMHIPRTFRGPGNHDWDTMGREPSMGLTTSEILGTLEFETKSFDAYMNLKAFLEQLFDCRVDLVLKDTIKPRLRERILSEALHAPGL